MNEIANRIVNGTLFGDGGYVNGIVFGAPMVRAILDLDKTQTRRLASSKGRVHAVGDLLWVREAWRVSRDFDHLRPTEILEHESEPVVHYLADDHLESDQACPRGKYRAARYMPQKLSRILLQVREVQTHKLKDISVVDASAEGAVHWAINGGVAREARAALRTNAVRAFSLLWETIHGLGSWERQANELVHAYTFQVVDPRGLGLVGWRAHDGSVRR